MARKIEKKIEKKAEKKLKVVASKTAIVVAEKGKNEFSRLTTDARVELAETKIRDAWGDATHAVSEIGQVLVDACHDSDEHAALAPDADSNAVFRRIVASLGSIRGGPSKKTLSQARRVAAAMRVVSGHEFSLVPYTHRAELVRLKDPATMSEGAARVIKFGLTVPQTEQWVAVELAKQGKKKVKRGLSLRNTLKTLDTLHTLGIKASLERQASDFKKLDSHAREAVRVGLDRATDALQRLKIHLAKIPN